MSFRKVKTVNYFCHVDVINNNITWEPEEENRYNSEFYEGWKKIHDNKKGTVHGKEGIWIAVECDYVEEEDGTVCILSIRH